MTSNSLHIRDYRTEIPGALSQNRMTWTFPTVTTVTSSGKSLPWTIYVKLFKYTEGMPLPDVPMDAFVQIDDWYFLPGVIPGDLFGYIRVDTGFDGKINKRVPTIVRVGKNIGRSSETNPFTQALRDAYGLYNTQLRKAVYVQTDTSNTCNELLPPMLAKLYKPGKLTITETSPVYLQPKYNGVRAVTTLKCGDETSQVIMYSRRKNLYPGFQYIKDELVDILQEYYANGIQLHLDGELYHHGTSLQDISGYARREDKSDDTRLDYMVYDCFDAAHKDMKYSERRKLLDDVFEKLSLRPASAHQYTQPVNTILITRESDIDPAYKAFLAEGFEGAMVRLDEPYRFSYNEYHSDVLLKIKPVLDGEYEIVDWTTGAKGKAASALMIICVVKCQHDEANGKPCVDKRFPVTPAMELPDRVALAKTMKNVELNGKTHFENQWLGKKIIIEYDELSKDNIPLRARTKMEIRTWD